MKKSKISSFGLKIRLKKIIQPSKKKRIASTIRDINMDYHPKGFAGNTGWSNTFLTNELGFSWYFKSQDDRDEAYNEFIGFINKNLLNKMDITFLDSVQNRNKVFYKRVKRLA